MPRKSKQGIKTGSWQTKKYKRRFKTGFYMLRMFWQGFKSRPWYTERVWQGFKYESWHAKKVWQVSRLGLDMLSKFNGREPKSCFGLVFNFKLGYFCYAFIAKHRQVCQHLKLNTLTKFCTVNLNLSMAKVSPKLSCPFNEALSATRWQYQSQV